LEGLIVTRILSGWVSWTTPVFLLLIASAEVNAQTPVAHWKFDDGTFNTTVLTAADSANGNDAIWLDPEGTGLSWTTNGQIGGAAVLNGEAGALRAFQVAEIPQLDFTQALSISMWFNPSSLGQIGDGYKGLAMSRTVEDSDGANRNWGVAWRDGNRIDNRSGGNGGLVSESTLAATDTWYHVVAVWDGDANNFGISPTKTNYVNGVENVAASALTDATVTDLFDSGTWFLGKDSFNTTRNFRGMIDDVAFFTEALTPAQVAAIYNNGLSGRDVNGTLGPVFNDGDVNGDLLVNDADFQIIRNNFFTSVTTRAEGDLVGDGFVDFNDFRQWKNNASAVAAADAIPEPTSLLLLIGGLLACTLGWRRLPQVRAMALLCAASGLFAFSPAVWAQSNIVLSVERSTGVGTLVNLGDIAGDIDGYALQSALGAVDHVTWNSLQDQSVPGWQEAGVASSNFIAELQRSGFTTLAPSAGQSLGKVYSVVAAMQAAGLGNENYEDLAFTLNNPSGTTGPVTTRPPVVYTGERALNNLVLTLNRDTGEATITNHSALTVELDGYALTSAAGSLNSGWSSLQSQAAGNWQEGGFVSANLLTELNPTSSTTLITGASVTLPNTFDPTAGALAAGFGAEVEDIAFQFGDVALQEAVFGIVQYVGELSYNNLVLNVDVGTGAVTLENDSPHTVEIDGYSIASAAGALDPGALVGLGGDFLAANLSPGRLTELNPISSLALAPAASVALGNIFAGGAKDLTLEFDFAAPNSESFTGIVQYTGGAPGDFDQDGLVDGGDLLAWQRGESPLPLSAADFGDWEANFGASSSVSAVAAIPEPGTWLLAGFAVAAGALARRSTKTPAI
jgi:hypothetical protein